jgi:glycosyltransferase involved in cell wall biosynthesis
MRAMTPAIIKKIPKISLVMIVKDEEEILEKCLEYVKDIVDEFIVVDTGSTDGTRNIIKKYGTLYEIPFEDFVTTKNKALKLATGDYILWMDADEILYEGAEILRIHAEEGNYDAITTRITEGSTDYSVVAMQYNRNRLWRRGIFTFVGPGVHEVAVGNGKIINDARVLVRHEHLKTNKGSTGRERFEKYVGLLKDSISRGNEIYRAWFYLGRTYKDLGESLNAIDAYIQYLSLPALSFMDEIWQAHYDIAQCYKSNGEYNKAIQWLQKAINVDESRSEAYCLLGDLYFQRQEYSEAIKHYQKAIHDIPLHVGLFLSPTYYSSYPNDQLILCYYFTGEFDQASNICKELIRQVNGRDNRILNNLWWITKKTNFTIFMTLGVTPEPIYGGMINDMGVGGVETTYLELSEELAKAGKNVFLFCNTTEPHIYKGVYYIPFTQINDYWKINPDIIITSRWFDPFYIENTAKKIIWFQDAFFGIPEGKPDLFTLADLVVCSSQWHKDYICERLGRAIKPEKLKIIPLGIRKKLFEQVIARDPNKVLYSSNPDRGLEQLIDMWDRITERIPNIQLTVTYGWEGLKTWSGNSDWHDSIKRLQTKCYNKMEQHKNISFTGRITKVKLAREMLSSSILVYPNNFWETFCLTALESQAAGTPIITTNIGALSTVVNNDYNYLLDVSPWAIAYQETFIKRLEELMNDSVKRELWSKNNKLAISELDCDWSDIGNKWIKLIYILMKE